MNKKSPSISDVSIREYKESDKTALIALLRLNTPQYFSHEEEADFLSYLKSEIELYFVVEDEHSIVGCGGINFLANNTVGVLSWDILHPDHQRKGIGTLLAEHRIELLNSQKKVTTIRVRTSQMACEFYRKIGFDLLEVKKDYWSKGYDLYDMNYVR